MKKTSAIIDTLNWFQSASLLSQDRVGIVQRAFEAQFEFVDALRLADSIHIHIKVENVTHLPQEKFPGIGGIFDNGKDGYVKYCFPDGLNMIFSSIPIAQDDLADTERNRRPTPFMDHLGIDLRQETELVRSVFDHLPTSADRLGWGHIAQGGKSRPVYCCHAEVAAKHWVYPPVTPQSLGVPLEFAFGKLKYNETKMGCDLRPSSPVLTHRH